MIWKALDNTLGFIYWKLDELIELIKPIREAAYNRSWRIEYILARVIWKLDDFMDALQPARDFTYTRVHPEELVHRQCYEALFKVSHGGYLIPLEFVSELLGRLTDKL